MAQTTGLVQKLTIIPQQMISPSPGLNPALCCVWLGVSPTNSALLLVQQQATDSAQAGSFKASMVEALAAAQVNRREVVAQHGDNDSAITSLTVNP